MINYEDKLNELKKKLEYAKNKRIKAETRLEQLQLQKKRNYERNKKVRF
ncbi:hypothetical protein TCEA9_11050 [Thermobrachium celere]|nr:hypothetical protein TCEA9_11050 [Thermobrachium celere]